MINISNLSFHYVPTKPLFSGLSLHLEDGGIVGIIGANGAGKTSLLKIVSGLLTPRHGEVRVSDFTPKSHKREFLSDIFYVGEEFSMPRISASAFALRYGGFYPHFSEQDFYNLLTLFNVNPSDNLHKMSFGSRKKVFLAFAFATNTKYLLLDEPTNGMDIGSKASLFAHMASIASAERTILISTHHISRLNILLDRIVIIDNGHIALNASLEEIARKLTFQNTTCSDALYTTPSIIGQKSVSINTRATESVVDISLLYNAVMANTEFFSTF